MYICIYTHIYKRHVCPGSNTDAEGCCPEPAYVLGWLLDWVAGFLYLSQLCSKEAGQTFYKL